MAAAHACAFAKLRCVQYCWWTQQTLTNIKQKHREVQGWYTLLHFKNSVRLTQYQKIVHYCSNESTDCNLRQWEEIVMRCGRWHCEWWLSQRCLNTWTVMIPIYESLNPYELIENKLWYIVSLKPNWVWWIVIGSHSILLEFDGGSKCKMGGLKNKFLFFKFRGCLVLGCVSCFRVLSSN